MSLLPLVGGSPVLEVAGLARAAVSVTSRSFASMLGAVLDPNATTATAEPGPSPVAKPVADRKHLQQRLDKLMDVFRGRLEQLLGAHGIDSLGDLHVQGDGSGLMRVASEHPQARQIEALLASEPELADLFAAIEHNGRQLAATDGAGTVGTFDLAFTATGVETSLLPAE